MRNHAIMFRVWDNATKRYRESCHLTQSGNILWADGVENNNKIVEISTGLHDKQGNPIFENDIIYNPNDAIKYYAIIYDEKRGKFNIVTKTDFDTGIRDCQSLDKFQLDIYWKIIGNTHEDYNLLLISDEN